MKLTEQRLKQIIKEEVIKKLLEQDDFEDYKKMTRRDLLKKGATAAVALAGIGGVSGLLKHYTDTDKEARASTRQDAAIEAYQKAYSLEEKIDDFNETCPLLELIANKAMKERHWDRIAKTTGHTFDFESEGFQLRNIMEAPLLPFKEEIEVCCKYNLL